MLGPDENRDLLRRACAALAAGGRVIIQDNLLDPDRTSPRSAALFALNMLVNTRSGGTYTEAEYGAWLVEAGFGRPTRVRIPGPTNLLVAARM